MKDLTKGKPSTLILSFALPVFLGNLLQLTYSLADTRIVGSFLKEDALAAVGATSPLSGLIIGFLMGLANGFAIVTAQKFGAGNREEVRKSFMKKLHELNSLLLNYSLKNNLKLGTTLTAMLVIYDNVTIFQVGDSRVYKFKDNIEILTKDQTFVAREVERGNITLEEAKRHPRRNVLLQCVGASPNMQPVITESVLEKDTVYMLCSDGMYHELTDDEFYEFFNPVVNINEKVMNENCKAAVELVKNRMEKDNISVILIRTS